MNPLRAIAFKLSSVAIFTGMAACIKAASAHVPPGEAVFFRSLFALPLIVAWLHWRGDLPAKLRTDNPAGHLWRGLIGVSAMACGFTALGLLPLPEVTAIGFAAPILATVFAAMFLGEPLRLYRMAAVAAGLVGVVIVLWPRLTLEGEATDAATLGAVVMLMGAVLMALAQVFTRRLVRTEGTAAIVFWFSVTCTCASLLTIPTWVVPTAEEAALLIAAGVLGGLGQVFLTMSYRFAETAVIAPFDYASMLFSIAVGWAVFAEAPTPQVLTGAALVVAAGIFIIWRESRLGLDRGPARQTTPSQG